MTAQTPPSLAERMAQAGIDRPHDDIEKIRQHANGNDALFDAMIERRLKREPLERIFGEAEFYGLKVRLAPGIFKPGFETETTVDYGLLSLKNKKNPRVLDLGTGTGCVLLAILKEVPDATGVGVDINGDALEVARENAATHGMTGRAEFLRGDWTDGIEGPFDLVISNPPRIPSQAIPHLVREVSLYDPKGALDGGPTGLDYYKKTFRDFRRIARHDGVCVLQVGGIVAAEALRAAYLAGYPSAKVTRDYKASPNSLVFGNDPEKISFFRKIFGR